MPEHCVCGSKKPFTACCDRFLSGSMEAKTPEQLMRSRYSAYAMGHQGQYLLRTWFPATAGGLTAEQLSQRDRDWIRLEVLTKQQSGDQGFVEFNAWYRDRHGHERCMHEKSVFQRSAGRWFYVGGEIDSPTA